MTRIVRIESGDPISHPSLVEAAAILRGGGLVAFPTETVYGLGGDATSARAVEAIFTAKERPADNPLIVHITQPDDVDRFAHPGDRERLDKLLRFFWPGPLTVVLPARECVRPATRGLDCVGLRMPDHPIALALIKAAGVPLAAPSANRSGRPSPTLARHVDEDLAGRIPLILDGGPCRVGIESTVLDLSRGAPAILRPGAVSAAQIAEIWGAPVAAAADDHADDQGEAPRSPGTRYRHYSPRAPVLLIDGDRERAGFAECVARLRAEYGEPIVYLTLRQDLDDLAGLDVRRHADATRFAHRLYDELRACDEAGVRLILVDRTGDEAVDDRLRRASAHAG